MWRARRAGGKCSHAALRLQTCRIYVSSYKCIHMGPHACPHTPVVIFVSSYSTHKPVVNRDTYTSVYTICMSDDIHVVYMCPHTTIHVSTYYTSTQQQPTYRRQRRRARCRSGCVYMCPHTTIYVSAYCHTEHTKNQPIVDRGAAHVAEVVASED